VTRTLRVLGCATIVALLLATTATARQIPSPEGFAIALTKATLGGNFGAEWDAYYPAYKKVVSRDRFIACEKKNAEGMNIKVRAVQSEGVLSQPAKLPLLGSSIVDQVKLAVIFSTVPVTQDQATEVTVYALWTGTAWTRVMTTSDYNTYKAGGCP
jgi:hypothetical protein